MNTEAQRVDWLAVRQALTGLECVEAPRERRRLSKDFYWYSPILTAQLDDCVADLVVRVSTEADVIQAAAVAARHRIPLTVRAGGTGNYGQCVPLERGLVLDVTRMCRVLDLQPGRMSVQAGARMYDMELAALETGQSLRMWPSTWKVASIGGFIAGGFGGIGSIRHGVLRDPGNLLRARVITVEREPRVIELWGDDIQKVHHAYGTNGIITEIELALSPAVTWLHCIALFPTYRAVLDLGVAASRPDLNTFLLSAVDARFAPFYPMLGHHFPAGQHAMFAMVAPDSLALFEHLVKQHGGRVSLAQTEADLDAAGLPPVYECAYNHTTLQALKMDRSWTYLQVAYAQPFDPAVVDRHMQVFGDEMYQHHEFARMHGQYATFSLPLVRWSSASRMNDIIREIESRDGCLVFNPHVLTIEDGGMKTIDTAQIDFKRRADPMGLMNPGKTRGWTASMARFD